MFWAWPMAGTPFLPKLGRKIVISEVLANFFQKHWIPIKVFNINWIPKHTSLETSKKNQIGCGLGAKFGPNYVQCCAKSKETGNIIRVFSYFTWGLPFKAKSNGCKTIWVEVYRNYSWKCQILRMLGPNICLIWVQNGKKTDNIK